VAHFRARRFGWRVFATAEPTCLDQSRGPAITTPEAAFATLETSHLVTCLEAVPLPPERGKQGRRALLWEGLCSRV
jgi:hypothetical protein